MLFADILILMIKHSTLLMNLTIILLCNVLSDCATRRCEHNNKIIYLEKDLWKEGTSFAVVYLWRQLVWGWDAAQAPLISPHVSTLQHPLSLSWWQYLRTERINMGMINMIFRDYLIFSVSWENQIKNLDDDYNSQTHWSWLFLRSLIKFPLIISYILQHLKF